MKSADDYRQLIVAYQNGAAIRLQDIATIEQGAENTRLAARANKQQAIVLNIQRQPGVNVITTADSIREMLPTLIKSLPKSVDVKVLTDRTTTIRASVSDVQFELLLAIALVVMVITYSCATCRRPLSPAWRCRCRWSAPSPPCTSSASPSTT